MIPNTLKISLKTTEQIDNWNLHLSGVFRSLKDISRKYTHSYTITLTEKPKLFENCKNIEVPVQLYHTERFLDCKTAPIRYRAHFHTAIQSKCYIYLYIK